jgi:peptidoglycan/LPS O-acetylase OafA/YrhL
VPGWRRRGKVIGVGAISALAMSGWYFIQNTVRYGDPLARHASEQYLSITGGLGVAFGHLYKVGNPWSLVFDRVPARLGNTFWYQSDWNLFRWPWPVNLIFWLALSGALAGLVHRRVARNTLITLVTIALAGFLSVWFLASQTSTYEGRYALVGVSAIAALAALGLERWRLPVRFLLSAMGLCGTLVAIQQNVLSIHWSS